MNPSSKSVRYIIGKEGQSMAEMGYVLSSEEMEILLKEWSVTEFREICTPEWKTSRPVLPCLADRG